MAYKDLTAAQRQNLSRLAHIAATETHRAREDFSANGAVTARIFLGNAYVTIDEVLTALAAALPAPTPDPTKATVTNNQTVPVKISSGGNVPGTSVVHVAAGAVTDVTLPATVAAVSAGLLSVAATGSGTKVTVGVANGVISSVTLSV